MTHPQLVKCVRFNYVFNSNRLSFNTPMPTLLMSTFLQNVIFVSLHLSASVGSDSTWLVMFSLLDFFKHKGLS